jgi:hypothetical protein
MVNARGPFSRLVLVPWLSKSEGLMEKAPDINPSLIHMYRGVDDGDVDAGRLLLVHDDTSLFLVPLGPPQLSSGVHDGPCCQSRSSASASRGSMPGAEAHAAQTAANRARTIPGPRASAPHSPGRRPQGRGAARPRTGGRGTPGLRGGLLPPRRSAGPAAPRRPRPGPPRAGGPAAWTGGRRPCPGACSR